MQKLFLIFKSRLILSGFLFVLLLGFSAVFAAAGTVSDQDDVDVSAVVGNINTPGGGGTNPPSVATVSFSGFSFPNAKLTLLKDGAISTSLYSNPDGTFQIIVNNLNFGNYQFSIYAEDQQGIQSSSHTVNVAAFVAQVYSFNNIVIPPTITSSNTSVQIGKTFDVTGYTAPGANVVLEIPGGLQFGNAVANAQGFYQITVRATGVTGVYSLRTKATLNNVTSLYSRPIQILYYAGQQPPPPPPTPLGLCVDYNKDRRVNLIDFSILLFWFDSTRPPANIDCNSDNRIDMKDFSILMYYWTG